MSDSQDQQSYSVGEPIVIGLELHDDSGIHNVTGLFEQLDNQDAAITLQGYGGGAQRATVYIHNFVTTNTPVGQYRCKYVRAQDGRGNYSTLHPDIAFRVDQQTASVDDQGPELGGWGFLPKDQPLYAQETLALPAARGTVEETDAQEGMQGDASVTPEHAQGDEQEVQAIDLIEGKMDEMAKEMTEDTGGHGDIYQHTEDRMEEMAKEMTEDTGGHGDIHLHAQRRMEEMAKEMFEED